MADRYKNTYRLRTQEGRKYLINSIYPDIPVSGEDIYIIATVGDRYDILADQFYGDSSLWWIIAAANNGKKDSLIPTPGLQLRVPSNPGQVIELFNTLNTNR